MPQIDTNYVCTYGKTDFDVLWRYLEFFFYWSEEEAKTMYRKCDVFV